jgi:uncharacterized membrane protein YgcG
MAIMEQVVLVAELVAERHWNRVGTGSGYGSGSGGSGSGSGGGGYSLGNRKAVSKPAKIHL